MDQFKVILEKNFTLHFRSNTFWINLYIPILSVIISVYFKYKSSNDEFAFLLPVFLCLSVNGVIRQSIALIVRERSDRFKELQTLMGLSSNSYYAAWIATFFVLTLCVSLVYTIPFLAFSLNYTGQGELGIGILIMAQILYCMSLSSLMLFLSSFFDNPSKASELLGLLNVVLSFVVISNFVPEPDLTFFGQLPTLFVPQTTFQMSLLSQNWVWQESARYTLNLAIYLVCSICQIAIYLIAFVYFDQVIGGTKSPFFLCGCKNKAKTYVDLDEENSNQDAQPQQLYQAFLNIQQQEQVQYQGQPYIQIENLWKRVDNQNVLQSLSLDIYQNEIFCLLGPNGAGKTTLMNILSGMATKTKGKISIMGQDIDILKPKNAIGVCMQKDILYQELNVYEHLRYYGRLRGMGEQELGQQINTLLADCQLTGEANLKTNQLSGGNKRKLCLAIALVGNSKIIFLDEPSSGMDALSRQQLWQMIKNVRLNRAIVLTTHHMEEADELASRVGILMNGQLVTQGTPDFIKLNFGVGYHLIMEYNDANQMLIERPKIQAELQKIDSYTPIVQSGPTSLKSVLPVNKINAFYDILIYLEQNSKCKYSLTLNSLEDSYLAIDFQYGSQNVDLNAQSVFQQTPSVSFIQQFKALSFRKLMVLLSSSDKQFKYLLPLPLIYVSVIMGQSSGFFFVYFYLAIKALTSTLYITIQLDDKDTKIKAYMFASGVQIHTYWLGSVLTDVIPSFIEGLITAFLLWAYDVGHFGYHVFGVIFLITIFGVSLSCFINCLSQMYKSSGGAYIGVPLLSFFVFINLFLVLLMGVASPSNPVGVNMTSMFFMIVSPFMACYMGFAMSPVLLSYGIYSYWSCLAFLIISGVVYLLITIQMDINLHKQVEYDMSDTDAVVDAQELTKKQGQIETVHKLSFQVKQKEIFGLLGPNGAGKSSTFNMISRFDTPTTGQVRVRDIKTNLGLVPQFCPFCPTLTVYQHLQIYGLLKGQKNIENTINTYLKAIDMECIKNRQVKFLSGGERRKVQIGIALIGGSNRLFMDEPTTGLDPKSRRIIQQMLIQSAQNNNASIVLTTHSLQEAQTICDKIGIMVNGYMLAQGTVQELRQQLGECVRFSVKCNIGRREQIHQMICQHLGQFYTIQPIYEYRENYLSYQVPFQQFRMSQLFQYLQYELKGKHQLIIDFQIYQPSLDQIFAFFASQQIQGLIINPDNMINNEEQVNFGTALRALMACFCIFW